MSAYAPWVQPIARRDSNARTELLAILRSVPRDEWSRPSSVPGWTCRDLLAHLAGDTGKWFAGILGCVLRNEPLAEKWFGRIEDVDRMNARDIEARRTAPIVSLIAEIEEDGLLHERMLSQLTDQHEHRTLEHYNTRLGDFLRDHDAGNRSAHDLEHLAQLREAQR